MSSSTPDGESGRSAPREAGYNPLGYHTGTVWPHENSLIAAGLARYGYHEEAQTIASAVLAAAPYFEHRLPEVFAGFPVALTSVPVEFPTASRPQAWAAGAPLLLLSTVLGLMPQDTRAEADLPRPIRAHRASPKPRSPWINTNASEGRKVNELEITTLIRNLSRPHPSGGVVIERAAILAAGGDSPQIIDWIITHSGEPETPTARSRGLHGSRLERRHRPRVLSPDTLRPSRELTELTAPHKLARQSG